MTQDEKDEIDFQSAEKLADEYFGSDGMVKYSERQEFTVKLFNSIKADRLEGITAEQLDEIARKVLTDEQWELEYQGIHLADKLRYLASRS